MSSRKPAAAVPRIMATNVHMLSMPLPQESFDSGNICGMMPYFAGLKKALCIAIMNRVKNSR